MHKPPHVRRALSTALIAITALCLPTTAAFELHYIGQTQFCTVTCDSFRAFGGETGGSSNSVNSAVVGVIDVPVDENGAFDFSADAGVFFDIDITSAAFELVEPVFWPNNGSCPPPNVPGQICNAPSANPLPLNNQTATVAGSGQIGDDGRPISGELIFTWTAAPLSNNGAVLQLQLVDGAFQGTLFDGVVTFTIGTGTINDDDNDTIGNAADNCLEQINQAQRDSNNDGYGNRCDADLDGDCVVNVTDLGLLRQAFFSTQPDADLDGDGQVNVVDLGIIRALFFSPPGPSAQTSECAT